MSISTVITSGFGSFGSVNLIPTSGFNIGEAAAPIGPSVTRLKAVLSLNIDEYGDVLYANLDEDISTASAYYLWLEPKQGTIKKLTESDGVTLGTVDVTVDDQVFLANEYVKYTTKDGDIDQYGLWRVKGVVQMSASRKLIGDYTHITVKE